MIANDTNDPVISVVFTWDPPSDPNGIIRYYRVKFQQIADGSGGIGRRKRVAALDNEIMNEFANFTGSGEAPTNITLTNLGTSLVFYKHHQTNIKQFLCSVECLCSL